MSAAPNQTIPGNLIRRIRCQTRDNDTGAVNTDPLTVGGFNSSIVQAVVDPGDNRVVKITPVAAGNTTVTVNKTPSGADALTINCTVTSNAIIGKVEFVEVVTPDEPKP